MRISDIKTLLIAAKSGRMLAQMAARLGYDIVVIDCFSDVDTQQVALTCIQVDGLDVESIQTAFSAINERYDLSFALLGSGFECYPASFDYLHQHIQVLGNTVAVFSRIQNKQNFFSSLNQLAIPYPETSFQAPETNELWLIKPLQGEGGLDIQLYDQSIDKQPLHYYWQRMINGQAMSVLFVADGADFKICGFHQQQVIDNNQYNFIFSGIMSQPNINDAIRKTIEAWITKLVVNYTLQGINTLDFMLKDGHCYALEINARPSASMQLYDDELITSHINSCLNQPYDIPPCSQQYKAYQIIYAETDTMIGQHIKWADWAVDIPSAKSLISTAMPICSIIAGGKSEQQVVDKLLLRRHIINQLLQ